MGPTSDCRRGRRGSGARRSRGRRGRQLADPGRRRPGHVDLAHSRDPEIGEVHERLAGGRDREVGGGDVAPALHHTREEPVAGHGDEHQVDAKVLRPPRRGRPSTAPSAAATRCPGPSARSPSDRAGPLASGKRPRDHPAAADPAQPRRDAIGPNGTFVPPGSAQRRIADTCGFIDKRTAGRRRRAAMMRIGTGRDRGSGARGRRSRISITSGRSCSAITEGR
jgi:hypothetical protein